MVDTIDNIFNDIRKEKQYTLDIQTMESYFIAYGLDKNTLAFNLMFPALVDPGYVQ